MEKICPGQQNRARKAIAITQATMMDISGTWLLRFTCLSALGARPSIDQAKLQDTERRVTAYTQASFQFAVFGIETKADRLLWEAKLIGTVSRCRECGPSSTWLGLASPKERIRESGLWLVQELYKEPMSGKELDLLTKIVSRG